MAEQEFLHPGAHVFFKRVAVQNEIDVNVVIITQISLREGLKKWVEKGRGAVHWENKKLHMRDTFISLHGKNLTEEQSNIILESHLLVKEKRDGTPKRMTVSGGNKRRDVISK